MLRFALPLTALCLLQACAAPQLTQDTQPPTWPAEARLEVNLLPHTDPSRVTASIHWTRPPTDDGVLSRFLLYKDGALLTDFPASAQHLEASLSNQPGLYQLRLKDSAGHISAKGPTFKITTDMLARLDPAPQAAPAQNPPHTPQPDEMQRLMDALKSYDKR